MINNSNNKYTSIKCVNCDECEHRSEICLCDISNNDDNCPLTELNNEFIRASNECQGELDFFSDLVDIGITLNDIKQYANEYYEYSKKFMNEHGLI